MVLQDVAIAASILNRIAHRVRPGYVRYDASAQPLSGVRVSAYATAPGAAASPARS